MTASKHVLICLALLAPALAFHAPSQALRRESAARMFSRSPKAEEVLVKPTSKSKGPRGKRLSPGYGVEGRELADLEVGDITVRQNLELVYGDLQDWDRAAKRLLGLRASDDLSMTLATVNVVTTETNEEQVTAVRAAKGGDGNGNETALKSRKTTKTETIVRSKILRTKSRPVQDRLEKIGADVMPLWMSVAHSSSVPRMTAKKVTVGDIPIVLWRDASDRLSALSDVCIHRGASLAKGWVAENGCITCPYHGFEFQSDGALLRTPGVVGATEDGEGSPTSSKTQPPTTISYPVRESDGWIQVFPRSSTEAFANLHVPEMVLDPLAYPEMIPEKFRAIEGGVDIEGSVEAVMENVLDLLHISYVHLFGNAQEPFPITTEFHTSYDDPHPNQRNIKSGKVVFTYNAGSKAWSKVVGGARIVRVENEFHLPYTAIIRVHFGESTKTIVASATPVSAKKTRLNYKLYRNFAITHPKDEGPINKILDKVFLVLMDITLNEDKEIVESLYEHARVGFMNGKYDKHQLSYRRAVQDFMHRIRDREIRLREDLFDEVAAPDFEGEDHLWPHGSN